MMLVSTALGLQLALASPRLAEAAESARLMAETVQLDDGFTSSRLGQIWSDQASAFISQRKAVLAAIRKANPKAGMEMEFFTASFDTPGGKIIVSAPNAGCTDSPGDPNLRFCKARVAKQSGSEIKVIAEDENFPVASIRGARGYDDSSNAQDQAKTMLGFDGATGKFTVEVFIEGKGDGAAPVF
jgi:hypothetical protein